MPNIPDPEPRRPRKPRAKVPEPPKIQAKPVEIIQPDDELDGFFDGFGHWQDSSPAPEPEIGFGDRDRRRLRAILAERSRRNRESLRLFHPLAEQERFFSSHAGERIVLGGNRGGKTTAVMVEIARAVTGQDPFDKYPLRDGRAVLVGLDLVHCSKVFYEKLFKPGAFKIIKDLASGDWRVYNPNDPGDRDRVFEAKAAPPLIPQRFYDPKGIAWEDKKHGIPKTIALKNGWRLFFFSSKGAPPQGWNVDLVGFDEEIEHPLWYPEMSARLLDNQTVDPVTRHRRSGKFLWSATPQSGTQQLYDLFSRAEQEADGVAAQKGRGEVPDDRTIETFQLGMLENQYVANSVKQEFIRKFRDSPDQIAVRVEGKFALLGMRIYSQFQPKGAHFCPSFPVPGDWTRYIAVDPGHQICAALFVAVVPDHHTPDERTGWLHPGQKVIYDELYIRKSNAKLFARSFRDKIGGASIRAFYIDHRNGRQTSQQTGKTNEEQFRVNLKRLRVESETTGSGFLWGFDDVKAGIQAVHNGLEITGDGRAEWVAMTERVPHFLWEIERYSYRRVPRGPITDEPVKKNDHLMDCFRYLAAANLRWHPPDPNRSRAVARNSVQESLKRKRERVALATPADRRTGSIKLG